MQAEKAKVKKAQAKRDDWLRRNLSRNSKAAPKQKGLSIDRFFSSSTGMSIAEKQRRAKSGRYF